MYHQQFCGDSVSTMFLPADVHICKYDLSSIHAVPIQTQRLYILYIVTSNFSPLCFFCHKYLAGMSLKWY
jgi:hypothetical protein